ncbi:MAG: phosphoglycerate kinase [Patescibacteria group bacterium]|nr:phosphoglycerate kinase [Patescibacteria group bacterium]MBU1952672.1 phosphoglycerate kinase [Patescibacteria group bacterium]
MKSLSEAPIKSGTRVFVRCDIDVPIENGTIAETFRLDNLLETLKFIIEKGGIPLIAGHVGRPKGQVIEKLSTRHFLPYFNEKLGENRFEILENLRFDPREEEKDPEFAKELASKAEMYVNESFGNDHREHTSIVELPKILPSYAGFRLQKEIEVLNKIVKTPEKPLIVIIGGAKPESKIPVIDKLLAMADFVLLSSLLSASWSKEIPRNLIISRNIDLKSTDIDSETIDDFKKYIRTAKTVLWAGPLGMYEKEEFIVGTREIALEIAKETEEKGIYSLVGGGDTISALDKLGLLNKFSFVSTGGSAMLQYLAEGTLPGITALN